MSTGIVDWGDVDPPKSSSSSTGDRPKVPYMKLTAGKTYVVRPVGKPMEIYKYFYRPEGESRTRSAICADPDNCPVREKHPELNDPSLRYAINVIDREDNQLKVLEAAPSVFRGFRKWFQMTKKNPGGKEGGDFGIDVEIPPGKSKLQTKYTCQFVQEAKFTKEEIKMIKEDPKIYPLDEIYKPHTEKEMERFLFGETDDEDSDKKASSKKTAASDDDGDDLFEDDNDDSDKKSAGSEVSDDDLEW